MDATELGIVKELLLEVQSSDNNARKEAEAKLMQVKLNNFDKYFAYMVEGFKDEELDIKARVMSLILLRRDILAGEPTEPDAWSKLTQETRDYIRAQIMEVFSKETNGVILNKIAEFAAEVAVSINDADRKDIWPDLFKLCKQLISEGNAAQITSGLTVYTESLRTMSNEIVENDADLYAMFEVTLKNENIDIALASLQAVSQLLNSVMPKYAPNFVGLLGEMVKVPMRAIKEADYKVLEDSMVEFIAMADAEPKFFKESFSDLFQVFSQIFEESEVLSETLKQQPIEFLTTIAERQPSLLSDNEDHVKQMLDSVFKLMIGIDDELTEEWLDPKDPAQVKEEVESDTVVFGKEVIDRLCASVGEEIMLPLVCILVKQTIDNDDWKYKNAGLSAFSQIAEYVSEIEQISEMIPTVIEHCKHEHPKVRHAAVHCLGQFATDLKHQLTENFHETVVPALYDAMNDKVNRVKAHASGSMSNFFEKASQDIGLHYCEKILESLLAATKSESSYVAGNAATCIASVAESCQQEFAPYFETCCNELLPVISQRVPKEFRKFKGQAIEGLTIAAVCIGMDCFRPYSEQLIKTLILIQKEHLEGSDDPQRRYILSAWQRLAMVMEKEFAPILPEIMPEFFNMASLQPKISSGTSGEDILDYLTEVENSPEKKTISIESDELEEKNIGIQMLCVFIDELKELYAPYVEKTSELFLSLLKFKYNTSIRSSTADSLPTMLTAIKECEKGLEGALPFAQSYISALFETMKGEEDTTVMQHQVSGIKRCIDIMGEFLDEDQVNQMCNIFFECISKSDHRKNINVAYNEENEQGDDEVDKQNRMFMEEENEIEDDLQLTLSEAFGALFKTHKNKCANLLNTLFNDLLPSYLDESAPFVKQKFGVYIVVDLVEHLGLEILGEKYEDCFQVIAKCSKSVNPVIRQAGVYGLGISSNSGGELFAKYSTDALQSLKEAIEMKVGTQDVVEFNHARDNAISALSKIMKYQHECIDVNSTFEFLLQHIPLKHDLTEAKLVNDFLADAATSNPNLITGKEHENIKQFVILLGEICRSDCMEENTMKKFGGVLKGLSADDKLSGPITEAFNELDELKQKRIQKITELAN